MDTNWEPLIGPNAHLKTENSPFVPEALSALKNDAGSETNGQELMPTGLVPSGAPAATNGVDPAPAQQQFSYQQGYTKVETGRVEPGAYPPTLSTFIAATVPDIGVNVWPALANVWI